MAWTYLAASEESASLWRPGSLRSPIVRSTPSLKLSFCRGCETVGFHRPPFGTTCEPYRRPCCPDMAWISFTAASPAKTSRLQALAQAWTESEAGFSSRSSDLSMSYNQRSSSWRTSLGFDSTPTEFSRSWPSAGLMRGGAIFRLLMLERPTAENDGGALLPTPTASTYGSSQNGINSTRPSAGTPSLETMARKNLWPTPMARNGDPKRGMPTAAAAERRFAKGKRNLEDAVAIGSKWPTPLAADNRPGGSISRSGDPKLSLAVLLWATPTVKGNHNKKGLSPNSGDGLSTQVGGALNPTWVEWLMGYPIEWTVCADWATPLFRKPRVKRSKPLRGSTNNQEDQPNE